MTLNTDLTDLSDVTDEAINRVLDMAGFTAINVNHVRHDRSPATNVVAMLARAIQLHPDMIVDPVTLKAREICAAEFPEVSAKYLSGIWDYDGHMCVVKRALAGMAMERGK